jgi:hypothetical protein
LVSVFDAVVSLDEELLSDWSPVELVVELLIDWSPVVVVLLLLSDWSPVDVVLSIVRLERPRRSMFGWNVDVEPVTEFVLFVVEPVIELLELAVEPLIDGLTEVEALADGELVPAVVPLAALERVPAAVEPLVAAWLSGMQSW